MKEPAVTQPPPSAEDAMRDAELNARCEWYGQHPGEPHWAAPTYRTLVEQHQILAIDALIARRVSAETERWQTRDRQRLEQISTLQETVQSFRGARTERSAPEGRQPKSMIERWEDTQDFRDATLFAFEQRDSLPSALASTGEQPAPPAAVVDYTERALTVARDAIEGVPDHLLSYRINSEEIAQAIAPDIADALSAVASERDAAAIRAFAKHVWSDAEEIAYQAGVSDTLAKLQDPNVRDAVAKAEADAVRDQMHREGQTILGWDHIVEDERDTYRERADAIIAQIKGMMK